MPNNAKQRREAKEKNLAIDAWYTCVIAMGGIPKDESLYSIARDRFFKKYHVNVTNIKSKCNEEFEDIEQAYLNQYFEEKK